MRIYLVRHGDSKAAARDDERPLSERGGVEITRLAEFLKSLQLPVEFIYHSEKLRAKQTADILASAIHKPQIETRATLSPNHAIDQVVSEIETSTQDTMWVGHLPFLDKLLGYLLLDNENVNIVQFNTGTMVCLEKTSFFGWNIDWVLNTQITQA